MEIWAHRGRASPGQTGNSMLNFLYINSLGITGFETDICFTLDKKIIIYHPGSTEPDLSQMQSSDIDSSIFDVMYLNDFLDLLKKMPGLQCCLDLKQNSDNLVIHAIEAIIEKKLQKQIYLTAFQKRVPQFSLESDARLLTLAKDLCPDIKTHIIVTWPYDLIKLTERHYPDAISIGWLQEPPIMKLASKLLFKSVALAGNLRRQIEEVKKRDIKVWAGIFNNPEDALYFIGLGAEGIMTDNPNIIREALANKKIS